MQSILIHVAVCVGLFVCCGTAEQPSLKPPLERMTGTGDADPSDEAGLPVGAVVTAADNRFGLELFRALHEQEPNRNLFISPTSISMAMAMTWNGAKGSTASEMADALGFGGLDREAVSIANATRLAAYRSVDPKVQLEVANALFSRQGIPFDKDYLETNRSSYEAEVRELDFADPLAVGVINDWVSTKTHGKITELFDRLEPEDVLVLANAVYFKGRWTDEFKKERTRDRDFHLPDGGTKQHPMMSQDGDYRYFAGDGFQVASLPYGEGRFEMLVFLPEQASVEMEEFPIDEEDEPAYYSEPVDPGTSLALFIEKLTPEYWDRWMASMEEMEGDIALPKFKHRYDRTLNDVLIAMGMEQAFSAKADFSGMLGAPIDMPFFISDVLHKTFVEVNEEGTEAAAVTGVKMAMTAMPMEEERFSMVVDRPFFYAIRDREIGSVLFMGTVTDPEL